jgi:hypothetical protein
MFVNLLKSIQAFRANSCDMLHGFGVAYGPSIARSSVRISAIGRATCLRRWISGFQLSPLLPRSLPPAFFRKKKPPLHHCNPGQTKAVSFGRPRTGREIRAYGDISYVTWMTPNHLTFLSLVTYSMPSWEQTKAAFTSCFS